MKNIILAFSAIAFLAFSAPMPSYAKDSNTETTTATPKQKTCKKGKLCGDTCISKKATCTTDAAAGTSPTPSSSVKETAPVEKKAAITPDDSTGGHPHCKKGKPCGHSCIAMDKVCHK